MAKNPLRRVPVTLESTIVQMVADWQASAIAASNAKDRENANRTALFDALYAGSPEGTNHCMLPDGSKLSCDVKINRTIVRAELESARAYALQHNNAQLLGLLDRIVSYDPKVVVSEFKATSNEEKKILSYIVVEKLGLPSMELKPAAPEKE